MGKKILLADDSITIQKVIELTFSDEDFEVVTVGNGRLAVERVPEVRPDLVLCDIIMPEKDGYEVCEFIKKTPATAHIPVLLLTGAFEPFDQERAARVGCDGFLAKPFEPQTLIAKVKDLLSRTTARPGAPAAPAPPPPASTLTMPSPIPAPSFDDMPPYAETITRAPSAPVAPPPATDNDVSFISDEPFEEAEPFEGGPASAPTPAPEASEELYSPMDEVEPASDDLMTMNADEAATLQEEPEQAPAPMLDDDDEGVSAAPWSQPTVEVPLEARARAGVEAAEAAAFDEVFEEELPSAVPLDDEPTGPLDAPEMPSPMEATMPPSPSASLFPPPVPEHRSTPEPVRMAEPPRPAPPPEPPPPAPAPFRALEHVPAWEPEKREPEKREPEKRAPEPMEVEPAPADSFADVAPPVPPSPVAAASVSAEVAVPVDMVEKIAQRVIAQISDKVIREIAWDVIPDLAEALIKKEIERLKAELQET
jgi:CheY-like chemotaxis protein